MDIKSRIELIQQSLPAVGQGLLVTLELLSVSLVGGIIIGTAIAVARISKNFFLSNLALVYVSYARSIPLLLVITWFYFGLPFLLELISGVPSAIGPFYSSLLAFTMFEAAYFSEIVRAGIESVSKGQFLAFRALGMSYFQGMRLIILPQVFRKMIPLFLTQAIVLFQDTSLVYAVGLTDFFNAAYSQGQIRGALAELLIFAGSVYFLISFTASRFVKKLERKI